MSWVNLPWSCSTCSLVQMSFMRSRSSGLMLPDLATEWPYRSTMGDMLSRMIASGWVRSGQSCSTRNTACLVSNIRVGVGNFGKNSFVMSVPTQTQ